MVVQWPGLCGIAAKNIGSIPSPGTKILEAVHVACPFPPPPKDVSKDEVMLGWDGLYPV